MIFDSVILKADSLVFGSRKLGTFVNGGKFDGDFFKRNPEHLKATVSLLKEWLRSSLLGSVCEIRSVGCLYRGDFPSFRFSFNVLGASGDGFQTCAIVSRF